MSDQAFFDYLLRLGDDSLVLGQRLGEWCGHAPTLEIDLSLANVSLDLIGQATYLLGHAGQVEGAGRDADRLAFLRDGWDFRNCLLVEQPNGDFAQTMARQFLFSTYQHLLFQGLVNSPDAQLSAIAAKAVKEVAYHADLAAGWVIRLGDGTAESHQRMVDGLAWMARFVDELFVSDDLEQGLVARGLAVDSAALRPAFEAIVAPVLKQATLPALPAHRPVTGGRQGRHSEHLGHLLAPMQFLQRAYPNATW